MYYFTFLTYYTIIRLVYTNLIEATMDERKNQIEKNLESLCHLFFANQLDILEIKRFTRKKQDNGQGYLTTRNALMFPLEGCAKITVSNQQFEGKKGTLLYISKNQHLNILVDEYYSYINIYMNHGLENSFALEISYHEFAKAFVELAKAEQHVDDLRKFFLRTKYLSYIFCKFGRSKKQNFLNKIALVKKVEAFILEHLDQKLSMTEIESAMDVDISRINYVFKKYHHLSLHHYVIEMKMKKAIELIGIEGMSVKEASEQLGYDDPLYFSRLFKKKVGFSPGLLKPTQIPD